MKWAPSQTRVPERKWKGFGTYNSEAVYTVGTKVTLARVEFVSIIRCGGHNYGLFGLILIARK